MPRRSILSATERDNLMALPEGEDDLIRHYSFTESDLSLIRQRRGDANRLGFAVQLCLLGFYAGTLENFAAREKSPPRVVLAETLTEGRANPALPIRLPFRFLFFARFALP